MDKDPAAPKSSRRQEGPRQLTGGLLLFQFQREVHGLPTLLDQLADVLHRWSPLWMCGPLVLAPMHNVHRLSTGTYT